MVAVPNLSLPPHPPNPRPNPTPCAVGGEAYLELRYWAESFQDAQEHRIRCENRFKRGGVDFNMFEAQFDVIVAAENELRKSLVVAYRKLARAELPTVYQWQRDHFGLGEYLIGRLLGHLGHPALATPSRWTTSPPDDHECNPNRCGSGRHLVADPPFVRTLSQLRAYCGVGDPTRTKRKGMTADDAMALGNPVLKKVLWLLASGTIKVSADKLALHQPNETATPNIQAAGGGTFPSNDHPISEHHLLLVVARPFAPHQPNELATPNGRAAGGGVLESQTPKGAAEPKSRPVSATRFPLPTQATRDTHLAIGEQRYLYRHIYNQRRAETAERTHAHDCVRCGPSGWPAAEGSPWSDAHAHADALRIVSKAIVADLYAAALTDLHGR